jgi:lysophospholipase L1-like esterase
VALALAACLVTGLLLEVGLRVAGLGADAAPRFLRRVSEDGRIGLDLYADNPWGALDVDLRRDETRRRYAALGLPDLDEAAALAPFGVECRYDAAGFRAAPLGPRRPGVTRVLVLGDSFTEGQGVRQAATYAAVLGRALELAAPGRFEVVSRGHRGWDFPRLYEAFEELLAEEPDVVVYGMVLNDAVRSPEFQARQQYVNDWILDRTASRPRTGWWRRSRVVSLVATRLEAWRVNRATTTWYREMYSAENAKGWRKTERLLVAMRQRMTRRHGVLLVALWPLLVDFEGDDPFAAAAETVRAACAEAMIPFVDLRSVLRGQPTPSLWVTTADHHPNERAHRLVGEALAPLVRAAREAPQTIQPPPRQTSPS